MPTLLQLATSLNVLGSTLVLALSLLALRLEPSPFFRSWVAAYAAALIVTLCSLAQGIFGDSIGLVLLEHVAAYTSLWFELRVGFEVGPVPFPVRGAALVLALLLAASAGLGLAGMGYREAIAPTVIALMATHVWLGLRMIRAARTPDYVGMAWIGVPIALHGFWLPTYPLLTGTPYLWLGFYVEALLEVGIGVGMIVYVLHRTASQLGLQNRALQDAQAELRLSQEAQERLQKQRIAYLEDSDRARLELLEATSHDLRTPLMAITGYADFLENGLGGPLSGNQPEYVSQIKRGVQRVLRIVEATLHGVRVEAGRFRIVPQVVDLREVVLHEATSLQSLADHKGVTLELRIPSGPLSLPADPQAIGRVVLNLLDNALKFTPPGGRVRLSAVLAANRLRIEVADTGIGIPPEHRESVFLRFYQVNPGVSPQQDGHGLGLAICKSVVEAHGGQLGLREAEGGGCVFWFTLPARPATDAPLMPEARGA